MRICKAPRKEYKFDRRMYRCFKKTPKAIRTQKRVCAQDKTWDNKIFDCVKKETKVQTYLQKHNTIERVVSERCLEGKLYDKIKRNKSKRSVYNQCKKDGFKGDKCKKCYIITKSTCKALGRVWKANPSLCKVS